MNFSDKRWKFCRKRTSGGVWVDSKSVMTEKIKEISNKSRDTHRFLGFDIWNQHHEIHNPGKFDWFWIKPIFFENSSELLAKKSKIWSFIENAQIYQECVFHDADSKYQNLIILRCVSRELLLISLIFLSSRSLNRPKHPQKFVSCKIANAYLKSWIFFYRPTLTPSWLHHSETIWLPFLTSG